MVGLELFEAIRALKFDDEARVAALKERLDAREREFEDIARRMQMTNADLDFVCTICEGLLQIQPSQTMRGFSFSGSDQLKVRDICLPK